MLTKECKVTSAYVNALALDPVIEPLYAYDSVPSKVKSLSLEANILLDFMGTQEGVTSLTHKCLGSIIGLFETKGLTNLAFEIMGVVPPLNMRLSLSQP